MVGGSSKTHGLGVGSCEASIVTYPSVIDEFATIEAAHTGLNLARYGDGELKLCFGKDCISQPADPRLATELREVLLKPAKGTLPCIPNVFSKTPKREAWLRWAEPKIVALYDPKRTYGSSFVTRPDSAPWIDTPAYWNRIKDFWRGRDVALVAGTMRSLRPDMLTEAKSVRFIEGPSGQKRDGAYAAVDLLERATRAFHGPVILCLGPTATVLANRLARHGVHAIDLGHVGMMMRAAGAFRYVARDLLSERYRALLHEKHGHDKKWGTDGAKHAEAVDAFAAELSAETILDYGCGKEQLAEALKGRRRVSGYDPGVTGKEGMPKPCDLTVCADVLEHVEREHLDAVFGHLKCVTLKGCYLVIATRPAKGALPDGSNAHKIVQPADWWLRGLTLAGFTILRHEKDGDHQVRIWAKK